MFDDGDATDSDEEYCECACDNGDEEEEGKVHPLLALKWKIALSRAKYTYRGLGQAHDMLLVRDAIAVQKGAALRRLIADCTMRLAGSRCARKARLQYLSRSPKWQGKSLLDHTSIAASS